MEQKLPTFDKLMNPLLRALGALGGSGSVEEIYNKVVELERFSDEVLTQLHDPENSNNSEVWYRLAWARTYLKKYGFLENSKRGVWALTAKGRAVDKVDPQDVVRTVKLLDRREVLTKPYPAQPEPEEPEEEGWKHTLHAVLTQKLSPGGFEKLVQRVLRESGFTQVEVTGRTGDGGIDGRGIARIHGLMSFHVLFQCKRYKGSVSAGEIRDFRGAMVGRADKGLFISTGTFSPAAIKEATRDGAPPIDLIDGADLAEKLKELGLGVRTETVEVQHVDTKWFEELG
jgi:restriction system protein